MDNDKLALQLITEQLIPALNKYVANVRKTYLHYKAMCMLNDMYAEQIGLSKEQVREGVAHCLHIAKAEELNKTLEQGDAS